MSWYPVVMGALGAFALAGAIVAVPVLVAPWTRRHPGWLRVVVLLAVAVPAFVFSRDTGIVQYLLPAIVGMHVGECLAWAHVARDHPLLSPDGSRDGYWSRVLALLGRIDGAHRVAADQRADTWAARTRSPS